MTAKVMTMTVARKPRMMKGLTSPWAVWASGSSGV